MTDYIEIIIDRLVDDCSCMYVFYKNELVDRIAIMNDDRIEISFNDKSKKPVVLSYDQTMTDIRNREFTYKEDWIDEETSKYYDEDSEED